MIIELTLRGLPLRTNNNQGSWRTRMAEARKWKNAVHEHVVFNRLQPPKAFKKAKLKLTRYSSNQPDFDGLVSSFKHVVDGLIDAKIIVNDKYENIGAPEYLWEKTSPKQGFITIIIESV